MSLHDLCGIRGGINLRTMAHVIRHKKILSNRSYVPLDEKEHLQLLKNKTIQRWLFSTNSRIRDADLFVSIYGRRLRSRLVEIHNLGASSSPSWKKMRESFTNHLIRHVNGQIHQLQNGHPNIIAVQASDMDIIALDSMSLIFKRFREFLKGQKLRQLSGVFVFTEYGNHVYIRNKYADKASRLTERQLRALKISSRRKFFPTI